MFGVYIPLTTITVQLALLLGNTPAAACWVLGKKYNRSKCNLSVLLSAVEMSRTTQTALALIVVGIYLHTCACAAYSSRDCYLMVVSIQRNMVHQFSWPRHRPFLSQSFAMNVHSPMWYVDTLKLVLICVLFKAETQYIINQYMHVAIPGRNRTLFCCIFRLCYRIQSAELALRVGLVCAM